MKALKQIEESSIEFEPIFINSVKKVISQQKSIHSSSETNDEDVLDAVLKYASGGKRIRPFIVKLFSDKNYDNQDLVNISIAFEMFHLAALIHDDIIDNANLRRGRETLHVFLGRQKQNKKSLGQDLAIIWGDVFLTESLHYASKLDEKTKELFFTMVMQTMRGQYIDIINANQDYGEVNPKSILSKNELKTAWYTFTSPVLIGLNLNGSKFEEETVNKTKELATQMGILYQIRDDIIDCQDTQSGKKLFGDIFENQTTWVTLLLKDEYPDIFEKVKQLSKEENDQKIKELKEIFSKIDLNSRYQKEFEKTQEELNQFTNNADIKSKLEIILQLLK